MRKKKRFNRDELFNRIIKKLGLKSKGKTTARYAYFTTAQLRLIDEYLEKYEGVDVCKKPTR